MAAGTVSALSSLAALVGLVWNREWLATEKYLIAPRRSCADLPNPKLQREGSEGVMLTGMKKR